MQRWNHYEMAFEAYLKERKIPFLAMAERYRNPLDDGSTLKNLDFVISRSIGTSWLIDIKGRQFPSKKHGGYWKYKRKVVFTLKNKAFFAVKGNDCIEGCTFQFHSAPLFFRFATAIPATPAAPSPPAM